MDEPSLAVGTVVGERYCVEQLVGLGGLAEVYRVRHLELGSVHAFKLLTWNRKSLTERLLLEGRIQAQLTHPHIVRVTDVLRVDRRVGLLLEFIEGPSLDDLLHRHGALPLPDALGLFAPVLAAVAHAHDAGVLHRDLKPGNVLLMRAPGGWVPKVTDFGLAKVVEEGLGPNTRTGMSMGTPGYMPPEQVRDSASADVRTDIFALGSVLYEMISGRKAFAAPDGGPIELTATIDRAPAPLTGLPPHLWHAIATALQPDRDLRYPDARAFAAGLGIADHPSLAASPDLVRVPLALDPSTYPSSPSAPGPTATPPVEDRRTSGVVAVAAILGSVMLAVLVVALMTQPVLESRRARKAARQEAPEQMVPGTPQRLPVEVEAEVETERVPEALPPPVAPDPVVLEPAPPPVPTVLEVLSPAPPEETDAAAFPEAVGDPEVATPPPPDEPPAGAPEEPQEEPQEEPASPTLPLGTWVGEADGRPFELAIRDSAGGRVTAEASFFAGSGLPRREPLEGTFDPGTGRLRLISPTSKLVFEGQRRDTSLSGEYQRGGRPQPWQATLR